MVIIEDPGKYVKLQRMFILRGGALYLEEYPNAGLYALNAAALPIPGTTPL